MDEAVAVSVPSAAAAQRAAGVTWTVLAGLAAWTGAAVPLLAVVANADRGVDAMDESHYLLAAQPWALGSGFNGIFGWYLGLLLRLLGDDVARLRVVAALMLVLAALPAARAVRSAAEVVTALRWPPWLRAVWPPAVVSGALCFYVVFVRTPGYNWFAEIGLLLVAAGLAALGVPRTTGGHTTGPPPRWGELPKGELALAAAPLGIGLAVTAVGKTTSALGALVVVVATVALLARLRLVPRRWLVAGLAGTGGVLGAALVLHLALVAGPATTIATVRRAAGAVASADPVRYSPSGLVRGALDGTWDVLAGSPGPLTFLAALPVLALLATGLAARPRERWLLGLALPGLVVPVLLVVHDFPGGVAGLASAAGPPALAAQTALATALVALAWRLAPAGSRTPRPDVRPLVLGAALLGLALCVPLGTDVQYATQTPAATGLFACSAAMLLAAAPARARWILIGVVAGATVLLAAVAVPTSRNRAPYRIQTLDQQVISRDLVPGASPLLVDRATAAWIDGLRRDAANAGWHRGTPLLDLTWHPASVLALDGRAPKTLLPAFPGWGSEAGSAAWSLSQEDPLVWRQAWLLVPAGQPPTTTGAATRVVGRAFPADYVLVGVVTAPYDRQRQELWRPKDDG
jgi:hypothetical protein